MIFFIKCETALHSILSSLLKASLYHSYFRLPALKTIAKRCKSFSGQWKQLSLNIRYEQLAEKELQKINAFKAPQEKLLCIMSCCVIINNFLLNSSMSENQVVGGPDDFIPVLIHVTIKVIGPNRFFQQANSQLHSNLKFIQLYGRQEKLVSESAYYFTNLVSAKSFIVDLNAKSLSVDAIEFQESMQAASLDSKVSQVEALRAQTGHGPPTRTRCMETNIDGRSNYPYM